MTAETTFGVGDQVTIAADHPPALAGAAVVWTIEAIGTFPGVDVPYALLRPATRSEYASRTAPLSRLRPVEAAS